MREVLGAEESHLCAWKGRSKMSYHIRLRTNANLARRRGNLVRYHAQKPWGYVSMPKKPQNQQKKRLRTVLKREVRQEKRIFSFAKGKL